MLIIALWSHTQGMEESLQSIYPIFFQEISNDFYIYTHTTSIRYKQGNFINLTPLESMTQRAFMSTHFSHFYNSSEYINITQSMNQQFESILFDLHNLNSSISRNKRETSSIVGNMMKQWFDIALREDLIPLQVLKPV